MLDASRWLRAACVAAALAATGCSDVRPVVVETAETSIGEPASAWRLEAVTVSLDEAHIFFNEGSPSDGARLDPAAEEAAVRRMFERGVGEGAAGVLAGPRPVEIEVRVIRLDALSNFERTTVGGFHSIIADVRVADAGSGEELASRRGWEMERPAFGGFPALISGMIGRGQETRITELIADETEAWFGSL